MNKFELDFDANELDIVEKPSPIQMMEPSLRTTGSFFREFYVKSWIFTWNHEFLREIFLIYVVFVAQIQAGMWRRNGHSLIEQAMAYHDSR